MTNALNLLSDPIYLVIVIYKFLFKVEDDLIIFLIESFLLKDATVYVLAVAVKHKMFGNASGVSYAMWFLIISARVR